MPNASAKKSNKNNKNNEKFEKIEIFLCADIFIKDFLSIALITHKQTDFKNKFSNGNNFFFLQQKMFFFFPLNYLADKVNVAQWGRELQERKFKVYL